MSIGSGLLSIIMLPFTLVGFLFPIIALVLIFLIYQKVTRIEQILSQK